MLTVAAGIVLGQLIAFAIVFGIGGESDASTAVALLVSDALLIALIWLAAQRGAERLTPATLGIRRPTFWSAVGWGVALFLASSAAMQLWTLLIGGGPETAPVTESPGTLALVGTFLVIAVTTPIAEELAFRGYLFPALTRWRGPWTGAILTGALFGLAHVAVYPVEMLPALALMGLGLCLLFWITGSLLPCIAVHAFNNGIVVAGSSDLGALAPLLGVAAAIVAVSLVLPFARVRAPQQAPVAAPTV